MIIQSQSSSNQSSSKPPSCKCQISSLYKGSSQLCSCTFNSNCIQPINAIQTLSAHNGIESSNSTTERTIEAFVIFGLIWHQNANRKMASIQHIIANSSLNRFDCIHLPCNGVLCTIQFRHQQSEWIAVLFDWHCSNFCYVFMLGYQTKSNSVLICVATGSRHRA